MDIREVDGPERFQGLRAMKKYGLPSEIRRRGKRQQLGQQLHKYEKLLSRVFQGQTGVFPGGQRRDGPVHPLLPFQAHPKQNRSGAADAASLLLKLRIPALGLFFAVQSRTVHH